VWFTCESEQFAITHYANMHLRGSSRKQRDWCKCKDPITKENIVHSTTVKVITITSQHPQVHCTPLTHSYTHALIYPSPQWNELQQYRALNTHHHTLWGAVYCCSPFRIDVDCPGIKVACIPHSVAVGLAETTHNINAQPSKWLRP
jgi:hypothetical protein